MPVPSDHGEEPEYKFTGSDDLPVENVSWFDAVEFCNKLSQREKRPPFYNTYRMDIRVAGGNGYRLPTEAEWEYACRAGSEALWPFGEDASQLDQYAWYANNSGGRTHPVGQKLPNAWGINDMLGNVWEWCADGYGAKCYASFWARTDPKGPANAPERAYRGGGYGSNPYVCRPALRNNHWLAHRDGDLGFRVVRGHV
jgi:formylglycine-generating enzyme required for sulfatase activity